MKILFSIGAVNPNGDANYNIARAVALALQARGHEVSLCITAPDDPADSVIADGVTVYRFALEPVRLHNVAAERMRRFLAPVQQKPFRLALRKLLFALLHPLMTRRVLRQLNGHPLYMQAAEAYAPKLKALAEREHFDAVICMVIPWEYILTVFAQPPAGIPLYIYQLDPWAQHMNVLPADYDTVLQRELNSYAQAKHVFTTQALLAQYHTTAHKQYLDKISAVEFPRLSPPSEQTQSVVAFDPACVNIVYCGGLEDSVRDPGYALQVLEAASQKLPLRVYFVGNAESEKLKAAMARCPDVFLHIPPQSPETAQAITRGADAVLNIDNTAANQVPSKLFDYICLGLPLISTVKTPQSPLLPYMRRYPLTLQLNETDSVGAGAEALTAFLRQTKQKHIPYEKVRTLFYDCTAEAVAAHFEEILRS